MRNMEPDLTILNRSQRRHSLRTTRTANVDDLNQKVYLEVQIRGQSVLCLLDTGCEKSIVRPELVQGYRISRAKHRLYAANGQQMKVKGQTYLPVRIGGALLAVDALVVQDSGDNTLGYRLDVYT